MQAARTYLERKFEEFESCSLDQLIQHSLQVWPHVQNFGIDVLSYTLSVEPVNLSLLTCISLRSFMLVRL